MTTLKPLNKHSWVHFNYDCFTFAPPRSLWQDLKLQPALQCKAISYRSEDGHKSCVVSPPPPHPPPPHKDARMILGAKMIDFKTKIKKAVLISSSAFSCCKNSNGL